MAKKKGRGRIAFTDLDERDGDLARDDLEGLLVTLDYTDSDGVRTRRRVKLLRYYDDRKPTLFAFCEMRNDTRSFLVERIGSVIDADGVAEDAEDFLARFDIWPDLPVPETVPPKRTATTPAQPMYAVQTANSAASRGLAALAAAEAEAKASAPPETAARASFGSFWRKPAKAPTVPEPDAPQEPEVPPLVADEPTAKAKPDLPPLEPLSARAWTYMAMTVLAVLFLFTSGVRAMFGFLVVFALALMPVSLIWPGIMAPKSRSRWKAIGASAVLLVAVLVVGLAVG